MEFIVLHLIAHGYLDLDTTRALSLTCRRAYASARPLLRAWTSARAVLSPLLPLLPDLTRSKLLHYPLLEEHAASLCCLMTDEFWDSVMPPNMTPLQYAMYFGALMMAYPCLSARIVENEVPWICVISPDSLRVKHLPTITGTVYYSCGLNTVIKLFVNIKTGKARVEPPQFETMIHLDALSHLLTAQTDVVSEETFARRLEKFFSD